MSTVPNPAQSSSRINDTVRAAMATLVLAGLLTRESADALLSLWSRKVGTEAEVESIRAAVAASIVPAEVVSGIPDIRERFGCPDWCSSSHRGESATDPYANLVTHEAREHIPGVSVSRTDVPTQGIIGTPCLRVAVELELETWRQAGEFTGAILDGMAYLDGADQ